MMFSLMTQAHAAAVCVASCALLQSGFSTAREIRGEAKLSGFDTILVSVLGPIRTDDLNDAQNQCSERAQRYMWWKPTGEKVEPVLYNDLQVVQSGDVAVVVSWTRQTECR